MTREQAQSLKQGDKVYIYGNKEKSQLITWDGHNVFGQRTDSVRFITGMFFNTREGYDEIEYAPQDSIHEIPSEEFDEILVSNGFSGTEFLKLKVPRENRRNERTLFLHKNGIKLSEFGYYVTYNIELIKTLKSEQ